MTEAEQAVWLAWENIYPKLLARPAAMAKRLARRRAMLRAVPRDACLCIRAGDARLASLIPRISEDVPAPHYRDRQVPWLPSAELRRQRKYHPKEHLRERLYLTADVLRQLARPVTIDGDGKPLAARRLGVSTGTLQSHLRTPRADACFRVRDSRRDGIGIFPDDLRLVARLFVLGNGETDLDCDLARRLAHPRRHVTVEARRTLFPSARAFAERGDPAWDAARLNATSDIPDDFAQTLERARDAHPALCGRRAAKGERPAFPGKKIPRWSDWRWNCPKCGDLVRRLMLPLPAWSIPEYLGLERDRPPEHRIPRPAATLACERCHRVVNTRSWHGTWGWNLVVSHLSGGLLYGREVPVPESFANWKSRAAGRRYAHRDRKLPSPRRDQIIRLIGEGLTYAEIAAEMNITVGGLRGVVNKARRAGMPIPPETRPSRAGKLAFAT